MPEGLESSTAMLAPWGAASATREGMRFIERRGTRGSLGRANVTELICTSQSNSVIVLCFGTTLGRRTLGRRSPARRRGSPCRLEIVRTRPHWFAATPIERHVELTSRAAQRRADGCADSTSTMFGFESQRGEDDRRGLREPHVPFIVGSIQGLRKARRRGCPVRSLRSAASRRFAGAFVRRNEIAAGRWAQQRTRTHQRTRPARQASR